MNGGEIENDDGSGHDHDCDRHDCDGDDCGYDFFPRLLRVQRSRSGCCCNQESRSSLTPLVDWRCIPSKGCLDTGTMMGPLELLVAGSKNVNDDAGWMGRRTT
jgi:hypothetical protein